MAQMAAQDYFTRLQASGLSGFPHPDLASAFPGGLGMGGVNSGGNQMNSSQSASNNSRQSSGNGIESKGKSSRKEKKSSNTNSSGGGGGHANMHGGNNSMNMSSTMLPSSSPTSYKVRIHWQRQKPQMSPLTAKTHFVSFGHFAAIIFIQIIIQSIQSSDAAQRAAGNASGCRCRIVWRW